MNVQCTYYMIMYSDKNNQILNGFMRDVFNDFKMSCNNIGKKIILK